MKSNQQEIDAVMERFEQTDPSLQSDIVYELITRLATAESQVVAMREALEAVRHLMEIKP